MTYPPRLRKIGEEAAVFCNHSGVGNCDVHFRIGDEYRAMSSDAWARLPAWDGGWPLFRATAPSIPVLEKL